MFYDNYVKLCNSIGKSPSAVALDIGIYKSTVSSWKLRGTNPTSATAQKIADYFGVSVDYLLGNEETKKAPTETGEGLTENEIKLLEITKDFSPEELQLLISRANKIIESRD